MNTPDNVCYTSARTLLHQLEAGEFSARELMQRFLQRIETVNPAVNAICTLVPEQEALALAEQSDRQRAEGGPVGPLHGLPIAVKDLSATRGIRTTLGSEIYANQVPDFDSLLVQRMKAAGALVIGKTNTPEFGTGSHTFNSVFGTTHNPWDLSKSAGGSSGGAAAALASGMLPLADGSDMGGSLRNPAAFCNVVGLRPSLGRVPHWPSTMAWQSRLGVEGPMARNVADCALLLSVIAGPDERDPLSIQEPGDAFSTDLAHDFGDCRVAWTADLGELPVDTAIRSTCEASLSHWETAGFGIEERSPNLAGAMDAFKVLRAAYYAHFGGPLLVGHRHLMKDTVIENIEAGLALSAEDVNQADATRTRLYHGLLDFFGEYDFLLLPSTQIPPFDGELDWVRSIEGQPLDHYLDWMSICCVISLFGLPALSLPCGFTAEGLPVGLQIVGRPRSDLTVLRAAHSLEQDLDLADRWPAL